MATAGLAPSAAMSVWHDVGRELARLHRRVRRCEDPDEWLDSPARELDVEGRIGRLVETGRLSHAMAADVTRLFADLEPVLGGEPPPRFLHGDMHDGNVLCAGSGELKAIIDWGDAGWGDSALDFATIPTSMVPAALAGYRSDEAGSSNPPSLPRIVWGQLMTVSTTPGRSRSGRCPSRLFESSSTRTRDPL
jgi:Ser/Thr protein kinase RdoA (MazF antagonist)